MKTTKIFDAMERALELHNHYAWMLRRHPRQKVYGVIADRKARQHDCFRTALLARLEAGDRAREALKLAAQAWQANEGAVVEVILRWAESDL